VLPSSGGRRPVVIEPTEAHPILALVGDAGSELYKKSSLGRMRTPIQRSRMLAGYR
jgi:hypothetical protein